MPAPAALAPIAWKVAQIGAVAAVSFYAARRQRPVGPRDIWQETALNEADEGLETEATRDENGTRLSAVGKITRGIRLGRSGPGIEMEFASISRLRFRKI
ncbi:MAG: hypothetical protein ACPGFA_02630 [Pikeienuella sp.]